ncbi:MAG: hypothetical protein M3442_01505 [Chloroflexota bacterium]|nr:hypothetical protein [Chloroflexota bacterium]
MGAGHAAVPDALLWDMGNVPHLTREKGRGRLPVTVAEVNGLYASGRYVRVEHEYWILDGSVELQWLLIGRTPAGRLLTVACQLVERDGAERYRPVTAWDAQSAEIAAYHEEFPDD